MTPAPLTSVIIPTTATTARAAGLERAIESVRSGGQGSSRVIVVANGPHRDRDVLAGLARRPDLRLVEIEERSFPGALRVGRGLVDTPYFAELDDDDELLPGALSTRIAHIESNPAIDVVVTNGFIRSHGRDVLSISDVAGVRADPLRALLDGCWLVPCAALYRTARVPGRLFAGMPGSLEWTYLAVRLALERTIAFLDTPTFIYHRDTPNSLSKSLDWLQAQPDALGSMMRLSVPADVRSALARKRVRALHGVSVAALRGGQRARAWWSHLLSLRHRYGWRYLPYTRHLLRRDLAAGRPFAHPAAHWLPGDGGTPR